jgi:uncharacterized membrane protein YobD (UPF0266 family)
MFFQSVFTALTLKGRSDLFIFKCKLFFGQKGMFFQSVFTALTEYLFQKDFFLIEMENQRVFWIFHCDFWIVGRIALP